MLERCVLCNMTSRIVAIFLLLVSSLSSCDNADSSIWEEAKKSKSVYKIDTITKHLNAVYKDTILAWVNQSYRDFRYKKQCDNEVIATFDIKDSIVANWLGKDSLSIANLLTKRFQAHGIALFVGQTIDHFQLDVYLYTEDNLNPIGLLFDLPIPNSGKFENDQYWRNYEYLLKLQH
ncbi:MAG: hypothetical protein J0L54_15925 [Chitinophagales bacterium]|nr:hypothetical protein [Chitinophagales bacterium]